MKPRLPVILTLLWLGGVGFGVSFLAVYDSTPGQVAGTAALWPSNSTIPHDQHRPTLVMFAHPNCPCTRASLQELTALMTRCGNLVTAFVLFFTPSSATDRWQESDLWRRAEVIPGVTVLVDPDACEATLFRAATSGHVVLYDGQGRLLYGGGITASRGHVGDNQGSRAIRQLLDHQPVAADAGPVFGCSLLDPEPGQFEE